MSFYEKVAVAAEDGKRIYGSWRRAGAVGTRPLVLFLHGFPGNDRELLAVVSRDFFFARGYDHFAASLYDSSRGARATDAMSVEDLKGDVRRIIAFFREAGYRKIYVIGHSFGGLLALMNVEDAEAVSLWDPAVAPHVFLEKMQAAGAVGQGLTKIEFGAAVLVTQRFIDEMKAYDNARSLAMVRAAKPPIQIIAAEGGLLSSMGADLEAYTAAVGGRGEVAILRMAEAIDGEKGQVVVGHRFSEPGAAEGACRKTFAFFEALE